MVSFSPDESLLVTAGDDSRVRVWSLDSREPILVFRTPEPCIGAVFSNDGGELALASGRLLQVFPLDFSARDADPNALLNSAQKDAALRLRAFALEPLEP